MDWSDFFVPYLGTNIVAAALLLAALRRPQIALLAFVLLFIAAAITNALAVFAQPELYVDGYGPVALLEIYRRFIYGYFARHTQAIILTIAAAQLAIGIGLLYRGRLRTVGIAGGVLFLVAIAPLGAGSGFPATVVMAAAMIVLHRRTRGLSPFRGSAGIVEFPPPPQRRLKLHLPRTRSREDTSL